MRVSQDLAPSLEPLLGLSSPILLTGARRFPTPLSMAGICASRSTTCLAGKSPSSPTASFPMDGTLRAGTAGARQARQCPSGSTSCVWISAGGRIAAHRRHEIGRRSFRTLLGDPGGRSAGVLLHLALRRRAIRKRRVMMLDHRHAKNRRNRRQPPQGFVQWRLVARRRPACSAGTEIEIATIAGIPLYDGDLESEHGIPDIVTKLKDRIAATDGLLLVTPEYNNSLPGVFKRDRLAVAPGQGHRAGIR